MTLEEFTLISGWVITSLTHPEPDFKIIGVFRR